MSYWDMHLLCASLALGLMLLTTHFCGYLASRLGIGSQISFGKYHVRVGTYTQRIFSYCIVLSLLHLWLDSFNPKLFIGVT